ncbi:uncharacterized protein [Nicotiana tomentosiformis]|uniref:uncharacterized protein n=1 Tax=Nicotiana tomentosiformis TaxID=4098 RepID=UPI00388C9FB4
MDVNNKTKDNLKAKMDLKEYCRRSELYLTYLNSKIQKPKASFTFTFNLKRFVIGWFVGTYGQELVYPKFSEWFKEFVHNPVNGVNDHFLQDIAWGPDPKVIKIVETVVDDELADELQDSNGLYEEFNPSVLRSILTEHGEETSDEELYDEENKNETSDED